MTDSSQDAAALIVGLTIQGLAIARTLARRGVKVYAVERHANGPVARSCYMTLFVREGINMETLADTLLELRGKIPCDKVVLFLCSDKAVRAVAANWSRLSDAYLLSWAECRELTASFTFKAPVYRYAAERGTDYPQAKVIESLKDCDLLDGMRFPLIVKPDQPPGPFKTRRVANIGQLRDLVCEYMDFLPFVAQEWVEGGDDRLEFCTLFMDKGRALTGVTGRKHRSFPKTLGRGTVIELNEDAEVREKALEFLAGLPFCGPVSVEFKRDADGRLWLIEPNVGRTEYCVDLTIQGGLDLPYLEYCYTLGLAYDNVVSAPVDYGVVWYDTEIEPFCFLLDCLRQRTLRPWGKRPVFPYLGHDDPRPLRAAYVRLLVQTFEKGYQWIGRRLVLPNAALRRLRVNVRSLGTE